MAERQKLETGMQVVEELEREAADGLELLELADGDEEMVERAAAFYGQIRRRRTVRPRGPPGGIRPAP